MKIGTNLIIVATLFFNCCSCNRYKSNDVFLIDLVAVCVNWNIEADSSIKDYAAQIIISGHNLIDRDYFFKNSAFAVTFLKDVKSTGEIKLKKAKNIEQLGGDNTLKLYLPSDKIRHHFPTGEQIYGDDCYQIELMNMLSEGKFYYKEDGAVIEIEKSPKFTFHIGPRVPARR
jgi:hypothetical protein